MRLPNFYCIGVQKAGTTWLHKHLLSHPSVWLMPNELKEIQYFNELYVAGHSEWTQDHRELGFKNLILKELKQENVNFNRINKYAQLALESRTDKWYSRFFDEAKVNQACGDITPEYSMLPAKGVEHVNALTPSAKYILLLRHPVERDFSHIRMIARNRFGSRLEGLNQKELEEFFMQAADHKGVAERSDYQKIIETWSEVVGKKNLLVVFYDDISTRPLVVLQRVCEHIGVDYQESLFVNASAKVFKGFEASLPAALETKLRERHQETIDFINKTYGREWL